MRIAFDIDGVTADSHQGVRQLLADLGHPVSWTAPPAWNVHDWGLPKHLANTIIGAFSSPSWFYSLNPMAGARELIHCLQDDGHDIYFITARRADRHQRQTADWMMMWEIEPVEVVHTKDKASAARARQIDVMYEDAPEHLEPLSRVVPTLFRPNYPFNRESPGIAYDHIADTLGIICGGTN